MKIKRKYIKMMKGDTELTRAFALLLWVKSKFVSSTIVDFSYNRLHILTGLHLNTIRKRIKTLKSLNLVRLEHGHLVFCPISSKSKYLAYEYKDLQGTPMSRKEKDNNNDALLVTDYEKYLCSLQVVEIQRRKDFVKHTFESLEAPDTLDEYHKAKKTAKRYGYNGEYKEFGLSYKKIAKELGVSLQKAFYIVKFAVENGILAKVRNQIQTYIKNARFIVNKYFDDCKRTFCTKDNAYLVLANTYVVLD